MNYIKYIWSSWLLLLFNWGISQSNLVVENNNLVVSGGFLVLDDTDFANNGTLNHTAGTVKMTGNNDSKIEGTSVSSFYQLLIQKTMNNVLLDQDAFVTEELELAGGLLDVQISNLELTGNASEVEGEATDRYVKTSSTGTLIIAVGANAVFFPVGNSSYNPATLENSGTVDKFNIRVADEVLNQGTSGVAFAAGVVDRSWFIDEAVDGGSDVELTLQWQSSDELTAFNRNAAYISNYENSVYDVVPTQAANGSDPYTLNRTNITSFSPFVVTSETVLPVELLFFKGEALANRTTLLEWSTSSEINNKGFYLERSENAKEWKSIGWVEGQGNSLEVNDYMFIDTDPIEGINYYRLQQLDFDGQFEYSEVIAVNFDGEKITLSEPFPNPSGDYARMDLTLPTDEQVIVEVFDAVGRQLQQDAQFFELGISNIVLTTSHLAVGTYYVRVRVGETVFQRKIVVSR